LAKAEEEVTETKRRTGWGKNSGTQEKKITPVDIIQKKRGKREGKLKNTLGQKWRQNLN